MAVAERTVSLLIYAGLAYIAASIASDTVLANKRKVTDSDEQNEKKQENKEGLKDRVNSISRRISTTVERIISKARGSNCDVTRDCENVTCDVTDANNLNVGEQRDFNCDAVERFESVGIDSSVGEDLKTRVSNSGSEAGDYPCMSDSSDFELCSTETSHSEWTPSETDSCATDSTEFPTSSNKTSQSEQSPDVTGPRMENNGRPIFDEVRRNHVTGNPEIGDDANSEVSTRTSLHCDVDSGGGKMVRENDDDVVYEQQLLSMESEMLINNGIIESGLLVGKEFVNYEDPGIPRSPTMDTIMEEEEEEEIKKENNGSSSEEQSETDEASDDNSHCDVIINSSTENVTVETSDNHNVIVDVTVADYPAQGDATSHVTTVNLQSANETNDTVTSQSDSSPHNTLVVSCNEPAYVTVNAVNGYCDSNNASSYTALAMGQICTTDTEGHENAKRDVIVTSESNKQNRDVTTEAKNEIVEETQEVLEDSKVSDTDVGLKAVDQRTNDVSDDNVIEKTEDVKEDEIVIQQETKETSRTGSTVKWGKDHVILNGSRSLKGAPTLCSLKVKFWCSTTTTNVENCCDFGVHVGTVEGLSSDTSKIYVKVILEDPDGNSPRIKKKTSPKKLTSSVRYDKEITLRKVPQPLVTRGRLLVAVWSKSVKKNKKICDVDIDFGKQIRFGEERSDVMTLSKKITTSQSGVEAILYLC
nr:uncharacterized protein LOC100180710 [Ciona intestinalis]|eukprot:XP_002123120.1 uncharacterized protein LOC100180710 [Ciona intestinalis]